MFFGTAALFAFALILGGLGPHAPLLNGLIEAAAFLLLVVAATSRRVHSLARSECLIPIGGILLLLVIGIAQLVPLAPSVWRGLPGRDVPAMVFDTIGQGNAWRPLSLAPEDTRLTIQAWLPPAAIFLSTMMLSASERARMASIVIGVAAISSLVALAQRSFGAVAMLYEPGASGDRFPGLFANINHQALFLACAVALIPCVSPARRSQSVLVRLWPAMFWFVALLGVLATASRAGLALFAAASMITGYRLWRRHVGPIRSWRTVLPLALGLAAVAALGLVLGNSYRMDQLSARFDRVAQDARYSFWEGSITAIEAYWPVGAGLGTFEAVYQVTEPLEQIDGYLVNHAHNDYIELVFELGIFACAVLILFFVWFVARLYQVLSRQGRGDLDFEISAAAIIFLVFLHSIVDYPLRTEAIGCLFAFASALLARTAPDPVDMKA